MAKLFHLTLSTPEAVLFDGEAELLCAPTPDGDIGIMADHTPLVSLISPGMMTIKSKEGEKVLAAGGGFVKISGNRVKAFCQTAEFAESVDEQRALEAIEEAKHLMSEKADEVSLADATALLERNIARLKTVEHRKKRSHH
jgi:F-type H+-transporting ATPase subunit epsilon